MGELSTGEALQEFGKIVLIAGEMLLRSVTVRTGTFLVSSSYAVPMAAEHPGVNRYTGTAIGLMAVSGAYGWFVGRQPISYYHQKYPPSPRLHE